MASVVTLRQTGLLAGASWEARPEAGVCQVLALSHSGAIDVFASSDLTRAIYRATGAGVVSLPGVLDAEDYWVVTSTESSRTISVVVKGVDAVVGVPPQTTVVADLGSDTPLASIFLTADDATVHELTLVLDQGFYVLQVNQSAV